MLCMALAVLHPWGAVSPPSPSKAHVGVVRMAVGSTFLHPHPQPAQASQAFIHMNKSESQGRVSSLPGKFGMVETALSTVPPPDALPRADAPHAATNIPHLHPHQAAP